MLQRLLLARTFVKWQNKANIYCRQYTRDTALLPQSSAEIAICTQ